MRQQLRSSVAILRDQPLTDRICVPLFALQTVDMGAWFDKYSSLESNPNDPMALNPPVDVGSAGNVFT